MAVTSWLSPSNVEGISPGFSPVRTWSLLDSALTQNNVGATMVIPESYVYDESVKLAWSDGVGGQETSVLDRAAVSTPWPITWSAYDYGSPSDLWGSDDDVQTYVEDPDFGVVVQCNSPDYEYLYAHDYGVDLPAGATVDGVEVRIVRQDQDGGGYGYYSDTEIDVVQIRVHYSETFDLGSTGWLTASVAGIESFGTSTSAPWYNPTAARIADGTSAYNSSLEVERQADDYVRLSWPDGGSLAVSDERGDGQDWPASLTARTFGGDGDTWGVPDLGSLISDSGFGVLVRPGDPTVYPCLRLRDYPISIPAGEAITGLEVRITRKNDYSYDGTSSPNNSGSVDAVEIRVWYTDSPQVHDLASTPSTALGGSSDLSVVSTLQGAGGAAVGGSSTATVEAPARVTARVGGSSSVSVEIADVASPAGLRAGGATEGSPFVDYVTGRVVARVGGQAEIEYIPAPYLVTGRVTVRLPYRSGVRVSQGFGAPLGPLADGLVCHYRPSPDGFMRDATGQWPASTNSAAYLIDEGGEAYLDNVIYLPQDAYAALGETTECTILARTAWGTGTAGNPNLWTIQLSRDYEGVTGPIAVVVLEPGTPGRERYYLRTQLSHPSPGPIQSPAGGSDYTTSGEPRTAGFRLGSDVATLIAPGGTRVARGTASHTVPPIPGFAFQVGHGGGHAYALTIWDRALSDAEIADYYADVDAPVTPVGSPTPTYPTRVRIGLPHSSYTRVRLPHEGDTDTEV